jgi:ActR/RegA family two-component response regulator
MKRLLVIEDGTEYEEFARLFLGRNFEVCAARSAAEAMRLISPDVHALLIDLRFDRAPTAALVGDVAATAERLFAGDRERALRHLQDNQGVLILAALRQAGHTQRAVFVHEFAERRLENLRRLYGDVQAVTGFDAGALRRVLETAQ